MAIKNKQMKTKTTPPQQQTTRVKHAPLRKLLQITVLKSNVKNRFPKIVYNKLGPKHTDVWGEISGNHLVHPSCPKQHSNITMSFPADVCLKACKDGEFYALAECASAG